MCQLLGMNCNVPTDICFSFEGFCARGGITADHADGWGIAFFEGQGCRMFLDAHPSTTSPIAELVRRYPIKSKHVIAHIRKATRGAVALENCHPFQRELWGRYWVFAHNGTLANFSAPSGDVYRAVGETDTEAAFCWMLETCAGVSRGKPPLAELYASLAASTEELRRHGPFNYLLSDGEHFFAHCSTALTTRAASAFRRGAPHRSRCHRRLQRGHDAERSRRGDRHDAAHRQRGLDSHRPRPAGRVPRRNAARHRSTIGLS